MHLSGEWCFGLMNLTKNFSQLEILKRNKRVNKITFK